MAASFYIESLTVTGKGKRESKVTFGPKLNILIGSSDSGKTMILDCIAYIFGKDKCPVSKEEHGYNTISVSFISSSGFRTTITREVGEKKATIRSADPNIISRVYQYETKKEDEKVVNDILFYMMGIEPVPMLASNSISQKKRMTWRNFIRAVYLDKEKLLNESDLIVPKDSTQRTLFLSIILYIIYGMDFSFEAMAKREITQARYDATTEYIMESAGNMSKRIDSLRKKLKDVYGPELPKSVDEYSEKLTEVEEQIKNCIDESNNLYKEICETTKTLSERRVTRESYADLKAQYAADMERLNSMVQGGRMLDGVGTLDSCPFCHNEISPEFQKVNIEAAKAELQKTMGLYNGLVATEKAITEQIQELEEKSRSLNSQKQKIENRIVGELKPMAAGLKKGIALFEEYTELKAQESLYQEIMKSLSDDQLNLKAKYDKEMEEYKERKYLPLDYFDSNFEREMTDMLRGILHSCGYADYNIAQFDKSTFNIELLGRRKDARHGQGVSTFLNSALYMTFGKYMAEKGVYKPGFLMLDTPLLGLKEENDKIIIHRGFFNNCILGIADEMQILVTVHPGDIPDSFDRSRCEIREYKTNGHPGFLLDYAPHQ